MIKWCDFQCENASFAKDEAIDGSGSCRTFQAVWCEKLNKYVHKNSPCAANAEEQKNEPSS